MGDPSAALPRPSAPADWNLARPRYIPPSTLWPAALALAVSLCLWGLASTLIITAVGIGLFIIALHGWIQDIRHERKETAP